MPKWKELKRFCDRDGWELYKDTDHYFYRKIDDDGNVRLTKVSKGSGEIHPHMWKDRGLFDLTPESRLKGTKKLVVLDVRMAENIECGLLE